MKKFFLLFPLVLSSLLLAGCDCEETIIIGSQDTHDSSSWFTEEELSKVGLSGLAAPSGCTGQMRTSTRSFNDGYSFYQPCPDKSVLDTNAASYFSYFTTNYKNQSGVAKPFAYGTDGNYTTYYRIKSETDITAYANDNPSPLYKFYYVTDTTLQEDGYFKDDAVWSLEIRYETNADEGYMFKLFIQNAGMSRNGVYAGKYKI